MKRYIVERTNKAEIWPEEQVRKRRVVERIYEMGYRWKGHKDRNRHKNRIKRTGKARLVYIREMYDVHREEPQPSFWLLFLATAAKLCNKCVFHTTRRPWRLLMSNRRWSGIFQFHVRNDHSLIVLCWHTSGTEFDDPAQVITRKSGRRSLTLSRPGAEPTLAAFTGI